MAPPHAHPSSMILTVLVIWFVASAVFVGSLAYMASRPLPQFDCAQERCEQPSECERQEPHNSNAERESVLAGVW